MSSAEIQPAEQQPLAAPSGPHERLDVEAGCLSEPEAASGTPTGPTLTQRAAFGFSALFKRLRRQQASSSSHERVPNTEGDEGGGDAAPQVAVINEAGAEGEASTSGGSPRLGRAGSGKERVCLICLDALSEEEFRRGEAIALECGCRGDLALRHKACAVKWVQVKGDNICELCKQPVRNLPAPPPRPRPEDGGPLPDHPDYYDPQLMEFAPTSADLVFDCVRVCWVACIVSILFFEMSLGAALWTGIIAGLAYSVLLRLAYRRHFAQIQALQAQQQQLLAARQQQQQQAGQAPDVVEAV